MATLIQAPSINSITIEKLSANFASFRWDDVGRNFYYLVELRDVTLDGEWILIKHIREPFITLTDLVKENEYELRVIVSSRGFHPSIPIKTEVFKTFMYNLYSFDVMNELTLSDKFIEEKFTFNNKDYFNFNNDVMYASLMQSNFIFSPSIPHISNISDKILRRSEYHEVLDSISPICRDDKRVMVGYIDDVMYMVERYQRLGKTSNDSGQSWQTIELFDSRIGDPITNSIFSQNSTTSYALGYDYIFYGRRTNKVRWSSINERFSQTDVSFTSMEDDGDLGYEIELFTRYAKLPDALSKGKAESFTTTENRIYVAGDGIIMYQDANDLLFDEEPTSIDYGKLIFNPHVIKVFNKNVVIKKMDTVGGEVFFLISGQLKDGKINKHNMNNIEYSEYNGVYHIDHDTLEFKRVFGNTEEERLSIQHRYTNMSTNGKELFINYANFSRTEYFDTLKTLKIEPSDKEETELIINQQILSRGYLNHSKPLFGSWRMNPKIPNVWKRGYMKYYNEADFTYFARTGDRSFITTEKNFGIVHAERQYTITVEIEGFDSERRIMKESWDSGEVEINIPNINFREFTAYSSGVMLYKASGEIVGYFEFFVDTINEVDIIWKPKFTLLRASLIGQTREIIEKEKDLKRLEDPNLVPFIRKILPENYFRDSDIEESRYYSFIKLYLEYISDGTDSTYKSLLNLMRNRDACEQESLTYLWSEMYKRNIYLDKKKKEEAIRFFQNHQHDFYSASGTINSYKFLFKLLYNEDVEIDEETDIMNYYITTQMNNIDQDIIGQNIFTKTGRCQVSNIERVYINGAIHWNITVSGMIGEMKSGQDLESYDGKYTGVVTDDLVGKELLYDDIDYINRGRSHYVMRIKSKLPLSRYKDDVIRFVHPVGIGFIGIVDITMFMNAGLHFRHMTSEINRYASMKFDAGIPTHFPDMAISMDFNGNPIINKVTGLPVRVRSPKIDMEVVIDEEEYDKENSDINVSGIKNEKLLEYIVNTKPSLRRSRYSPLFDSSGSSFSKFKDLSNSFIKDSYKYRLIDNIGRPRDSNESTQRKLNEEVK